MKRTPFAVALALGTAVGALACGGESGPAAPARPPPREVLGLAVRVAQASSDDMFCPALAVGLTRSGMTTTNDASQPVDATLTCSIFTSPDDGWIQIQQNGESRMKYTIRVDVRSAQNVLVDQFIAQYKAYRSAGADEEAVGRVVLAFAYSPRIAAFARIAKAAAPVPVPSTVTTQPLVTTATLGDPRDDAMWFAIDTVKCKIPARVDACNAVRGYLQRHPNGAHAQEANAILSAAQAALEQLQKDEVAWQKVNRSECASKRTSTACVGVEAYEMQFPTGIHTEEARRLLKAAGIDK